MALQSSKLNLITAWRCIDESPSVSSISSPSSSPAPPKNSDWNRLRFLSPSSSESTSLTKPPWFSSLKGFFLTRISMSMASLIFFICKPANSARCNCSCKLYNERPQRKHEMRSANSTIPQGMRSMCLSNTEASICRRCGLKRNACWTTGCESASETFMSFMMVVSARTAIFAARFSFATAMSALRSISHLHAFQANANCGVCVAFALLSGASLGNTKGRKAKRSAQCSGPGQRTREKIMSLYATCSSPLSSSTSGHTEPTNRGMAVRPA